MRRPQSATRCTACRRPTVTAHRIPLRRAHDPKRSAGVRALDTEVATYVRAFEDEAAYEEVKAAFARNAQRLIDDGAEFLADGDAIVPLPVPRS